MCTFTAFICRANQLQNFNTALTSYSVSPGLDDGLSGPPGENGFEVTFSCVGRSGV
jgi:hypothetical protein